MLLPNSAVYGKKKSVFIKMINLEWIKSLTHFIEWRKIYARISFKTAMIYL